MNRFALIAVSIFILLSKIFAQVPILEWTNSYYNTYSFSYSMSKDNLGNIFICGYNRPFANYKYMTLNFNTSGIINWANIFEGNGTRTSGIAEKCIVDGIGNVYICGTYFKSNDDVLLIKLNSSGDTIWTAQYNGSETGNDIYADMVKDKFSNVFITCRSDGTASTGLDYLTIKYDSTGNKIWEARYNNFFNSTDEAQAIAIDSLQNIYVTGYCLGLNSKNEYVTVKYNQSGLQQWVSKHNSNTGARALKISIDRENNVYVAGMIDSMEVPNHTKYRTIKYDQNGNEIWYRDFNSLIYFMNTPHKLLIDSLNSPIIVGTSIVKYNKNGLFIWSDTISPGYACDLDKLNNLYVFGGRADTPNYLRTQAIKYSPYGNKIWTINLEHLKNQEVYPAAVLVDNSDFYLCTNFQQLGKNSTDSIILFKYSQPIGIVSNNNEIPERFNLYQNFPNPFNPSTKIKFDIPATSSYLKEGNVELIIYDILGKEISKLIHTDLKPGKYEYEWNATGFASGIYFYSLKSSSIIITKKMLLIK